MKFLLVVLCLSSFTLSAFANLELSGRTKNMKKIERSCGVLNVAYSSYLEALKDFENVKKNSDSMNSYEDMIEGYETLVTFNDRFSDVQRILDHFYGVLRGLSYQSPELAEKAQRYIKNDSINKTVASCKEMPGYTLEELAIEILNN